MLIPPKDWSNESAGGYMLNELMQGHDLVRRGDPSRIQGEIPIDFSQQNTTGHITGLTHL